MELVSQLLLLQLNETSLKRGDLGEGFGWLSALAVTQGNLVEVGDHVTLNRDLGDSVSFGPERRDLLFEVIDLDFDSSSL